MNISKRNDDPRVTVLMTVHNGARHVAQAINSTLAQTFADFELLIVDDASTDDTVAIVNGYDDPRIRVIRNEQNLNQVVSLNRGLAEARGAYIARLDHDDVSLPERLARQVAFLDAQSQVGVVGSWMDVRDDEDRRVTLLDGRVGDVVDWVWALLTDRPLLGHPAVMFRLDAVRALDGYDPSLRWAEDRDLWNRLALAGWHGAVLEEILVRYRWHEGQQSQTANDLQREASDRAIERLAGALAGEGHARLLRTMLAVDPGAFWHDESAPAAPVALDALVEGARSRLHFDDEQARAFELLVARRAASLAARGWKDGSAAQWRIAPPLWRWARRHGGSGSPAAFASAVVTAPVLHATRSSVARLRRWARGRPGLTRVFRRVVRR
jgi:GT2 family glycosyltransferase